MALYRTDTPTVVGDLQVGHFQADRALGVYNFQVELRGHLTASGVGAPFDLREIRAYVTAIVMPKSTPKYIGPMWRYGRAHAVRCTSEHEYAAFGLEFQLTPQRVQELEDLREGGSIQFQIEIWGVAVSDAGDRFPVHDLISHLVSQSEWVNLLGRLGHGKTVLLEVGLPTDKATAEYKLVVDHLERAIANRGRGDWEGVVVECRKALEALDTVIGAPARQLPEWKDKEDWTKNERIRKVRQLVHHLAHPAAHPGGTWEPVDAQTILAMTAALARLITGQRP